jgi:hypothetical protein
VQHLSISGERRVDLAGQMMDAADVAERRDDVERRPSGIGGDGALARQRASVHVECVVVFLFVVQHAGDCVEHARQVRAVEDLAPRGLLVLQYL